MSDLAGLLKELEQVAKDTNLKEVKNKPLEESVASKDDVSSLFEGLEAAYTESKIEEEIANRLSEEDEQKLGAFSGFMESVTELTNQPNPQKAIEDLFATVAPPQPPVEVLDEPVVIEKIVEEPNEVVQADTIIQQIVSSLDDMDEKTEVKEQVDQISKLRDEFNNFRALMQQQVLSHTPGSGEVRLEFLDDVQRSTAKVDGKFLKYSSSDSKWIGADASGGGSSAADDISAGDSAVTITTTSGDITIDAAANNSDIIFKGTDGGSDITILTLDGSEAGAATFNSTVTSGAGLVIADAGNIGSASDTDAIAIASNGVVTFSQNPVFPDGGVAIADLDIDGGTDIGAGLADADLFVVDDGAGGSNRKTAASRIKTYVADVTLTTAAQGNVTSLGTLTTLTVDNVIINGTTIGHTDDTDLITLADGKATVAGEVQLTTLDIGGTNVTSTAAELNLLDGSSANSVVNSKAVIYGSSGEVAGTLSTAAQTNITSVGTLTALTVDDVAVNGKVITMTGSSSDTAVFTAGTHGTLSIVTTDDAAAAANIQITADGTVDIDSAGVLTLDSGAAINIEPAAGSAILLDGTISVDAGVVTGATSITSTAFVGDITGDVTGNTSGTAATVTTAAQTNITSLGTLTALTVDNVVINGATIGHGDDTDLMTVADGVLTVAGEVDAATLDISGDADIDGTLEADAYTVNGTALDEFISDTVGAMVGSNTETGLAVTYQDGDNTLDFAINAAQTTITSIYATDLILGEDAQTAIDFGTANEIDFKVDNAARLTLTSGALYPVTDNQIDLGTSSLEFKDAFFDGTVTSDAFAGPLTGDVTGTSSKVAVTDSTANTNFPVVFHDESNALLDDTGALRYNPSTGELLVPVLTVAGTTTTVDTVTMQAENAIIFEGATADAHETTLTIVDPTADRTINLPNQSGTIPVLAAASNTAVTSTPAELNLLDGSSANSVVNSKAVIYGSSGELAGTLSTAAQTNVTSLGTLTALTVDDVAVNGKVITMTGSSSDTAVFTAGTHGTLSIVTTDDAAAAANIQITADGTVDIDSAGVLTLDSGAAINIEPASGSAILLDGTISVDAGVVTGATSITSTAFVGDITGDVTGNTSGTAATVTTAAQTNITSLGTLTALTVDDVVINGKVMTMTGSTDDTAVFTAGTHGTLSIVTTDTAAAAANITITADGTFEADGTTITLDSAGDIVLDAAGNNVTFKSAGTAILDISNSSSDAVITSSVQDKDIIFKGDDGGAAITALTLDMSAAGDAIFNNDIYVDKIRRASDSGTTTKILLNDEVLKLYAGHSSNEVVNIASGAVAVTGSVTASGIIKTDDTTAATSTTDGSLQTDGGLSVAADAVIGDDLILLSDAAVLTMGADKDVTLTHVHNTGILLNSTMVIQFNDASQNIGAPSNAILDINATDEVEINATLIDVNGNLDVSGTGVIAGAITGAAITASGILKTDDATEATSTTDGSLQTDGGLSVVKDAVFGDDVKLLSDSAVLSFGADSDTTLTHTDGTGLTLNSTNKLCFNDATQFIQGASGTILDIAATDEIELTATLIDVNGNLDVSGTGVIAGAITGAAITASGILKTDDATEATSTTDGSLQTDGGLSVVKDAVFGDDVKLLSDAAVLSFGANSEVTLTHVHNDGLLLNTDMQLQFRDSAINIRSDADGDLDINADDEIELNSTLIDINGNVEISGTLAHAGDVTFAAGAELITATAGTSNFRAGVNAGTNIASGGNYNILIGGEAGNDLTTGDYNVAVGYGAFDAATTNSFNTAIGALTLTSANKAGDPEVVAVSNVAVGYNTLQGLTTGSYNTGCGTQSLQSTTTALSNTVTGYAAMLLNTTGSYNHAYGHAALYNCRTGYGNVAMGYLAAFTVDSGIYNVGIGYQSLYYDTGNYNTGVGAFSLMNTAAGEHNTALGYQAGDVITSGSYNICIGNLTDPSANSSTHQIVIGYNITGGEDNQFTFGKASNVVQNEFDTDANWTRTSDRRKKRNIEDDTLGLEFINNLRTVTHQWKPSNEFPEEWDEYSEENTMNLDAVMHGMIAQEVKEALDKSGCDTFGGWDERSDGSQTVSREMFVIPLIKAVQELSAEVKELKEKLND